MPIWLKTVMLWLLSWVTSWKPEPKIKQSAVTTSRQDELLTAAQNMLDQMTQLCTKLYTDKVKLEADATHAASRIAQLIEERDQYRDRLDDITSNALQRVETLQDELLHRAAERENPNSVSAALAARRFQQSVSNLNKREAELQEQRVSQFEQEVRQSLRKSIDQPYINNEGGDE